MHHNLVIPKYDSELTKLKDGVSAICASILFLTIAVCHNPTQEIVRQSSDQVSKVTTKDKKRERKREKRLDNAQWQAWEYKYWKTKN